MSLLVLFGLDEDLLVQLLGVTLQNHAATFVHQLIDVAVQRWGGEAHRLLGLEDSHAARGWEGSSVAAPGPAVSRGRSPSPHLAPSDSPEGANMDNLPITSAAALRGGPAALPLPPFLSPGSKKSPGRSPRRTRHVHRLPAVAGNAPLGGHSDPQRGGLAAPKPLLQPRRGHPAGSTRRTAQALPKPGLGQQLGRVPALKGF